jgi:protein-disulfide isomerase/uncharacterized membrane protein
MRKNLWFWLTAVLTIAALVASAILLVDYVRPAPVFCEASGCAKVKLTAFARPFGVPMPAIGIAGMLGLGLAALVPGRAARFVHAALAAVGALVALVLFSVQGLMGVLCPFCAVVDGAALVLAGLAFLRLRKAWDPPPGRAIPSAVALFFVAAAAIPFGIGINRRAIPRDVPPVIAEEIEKTGSKKVTVVDFVDFECPFCRMTHAELAPLLEKQKAKVHVVRKHVPLRMHPHAMDAAKAGCCGETLGKGDEMADALFKAPPEELTPEGCEKLAKEQGLDLERFRACVRDPATAARIDQDKEAFRAVKGHGLPTIWIDGTRLDGAQDHETLEATLDSAIRAL